jgi:hypothetical protein
MINAELKKALTEIGPIDPWWSEEDGMFVFEHAAYPFVLHADPDRQETVDGYLRALRGFIEDRMNGDLAESVDRITSGRGGRRSGAGRPKQDPKVRKWLPPDIAAWLEDPVHVEQVRKLMQA